MRNTDRSGLLLELLFDGSLADTSGGRRTCTGHGTLGFGAGRRGQCASFDGTSWVDTGLMQDDLGADYTVECWVNPAPEQSRHADIFGNHIGEGLGFVVQQDGDSTNEFLAACGAGDARWVLTETVPLVPARWQHVALVKAGNELRFHVNGVLAARTEGTPARRPSTMPVAVGLGYTAEERCFRGMIDEFRVWGRPLSDFSHAGIDPADARQVQALLLGPTPRPAAGEPGKTWTLATEDTRLRLGVTDRGEPVVVELLCPTVGHNWIARPVALPLPSHADVGDRREPLDWRFAEATVDDADGRTVTLRFEAGGLGLELIDRWQASPGTGPVCRRMRIVNRSGQTVGIPRQPTFDLDLAGAAVLWSFHTDGRTPDPVGVYRQPLATDQPGQRLTVRTAPSGEFIPYIVLDADGQHGAFIGLEWSVCRLETVTLPEDPLPTVRVRGGLSDWRVTIAPGDTFDVPPGFIGAYRGDLDDAGNRLRRWLSRTCMPAPLRDDSGYPKVQWNAFGATGKTPGSWDPVESGYYPLIDDIAPLGFEEVMIDVGWWQGGEPDSDQADWPSGMAKAAEYAHAKGLRFGLYWTDDLDMASPEGRNRRAARIRRLFREYGADMWRSDCTRGAVLGASYAATRGFYALVDALAAEIPGFMWENCSGGGRIKDYGAMGRCVKIFNSDTYSPLHVRQAFYDSSYALHPIQIEGHLGSVDGRFRPQGAAGMKHAFRSMSMGAPEWFLDAPNGGNGTAPWTQEEREAVKSCVATYKTRIRPLVRAADLYHVLPRPNDRDWDGVEYYDPVTRRGVVFLFRPVAGASTQTIRLRGLDPRQACRLTFEDGTNPPVTRTGEELLRKGHTVTLRDGEPSELMFIEPAR